MSITLNFATLKIIKRPVKLKDAVLSKLQSRNLDLDMCSAYIHDTK